MEKTKRENIDLKDAFQIIVGSFAAAIVFAPSNEFRGISQNLPIYKLLLIFLLTLIFTGLLAYWIGGRKLRLREIRTVAYIIPVRIVLIYSISLFSCFVALWLYNIISISSDPILIIREMIVLSLPATWGGTLLDLIYSKNR